MLLFGGVLSALFFAPPTRALGLPKAQPQTTRKHQRCGGLPCVRCALAPASSGNTTASESFLFCVSRTKQSDSLSALRLFRCGLKGSKRKKTLVLFLKCLLWFVSLPLSRRRCLRHLGSLTGTLWCVKLLFVSRLFGQRCAKKTPLRQGAYQQHQK